MRLGKRQLSSLYPNAMALCLVQSLPDGQGLFIVTLTATKGPSGVGEILRPAQNDKLRKAGRGDNEKAWPQGIALYMDPTGRQYGTASIDAITSGFSGSGGKILFSNHSRSFSATAADICNLVSRQACGEWRFENRNSVQHSFQVRDSS